MARKAGNAPQSGHALCKRSVIIAGHKTSVSIENAFWEALKEIAGGRGVSLNTLIEEIDKARAEKQGNLSSAIRLFVLGEARQQSRTQK